MKVQIGHSRDFDYNGQLYEPIKQSDFFYQHTWIFPHESWLNIDSDESLNGADVFVAEVSYPSTWLGIELALAKAKWKRIICLYKKWATISSSINKVTEEVFEYTNIQDFLEKLKMLI